MSELSELGLRVGDRVRVRSIAEILPTLDADGCLDALPFMPEMAMRCGGEFTVLKRIEKINDLVDRSGLRRMRDAVILEGDRCDGSRHGGCQQLCQSIWKEAWLVRADSSRRQGPQPPEAPGPAAVTEQGLLRACRAEPVGGEERFRCQQTELKKASCELVWWDPRQYVRDWRSGNVSLGEMARVFLFWLFRLFVDHVGGYRPLVSLYDRIQRWRGGEPFPYRSGSLRKTPNEQLGLRVGEWVQVKSHEEIVATLDTRNRNRGMWFDAEMVKYCNGVYRVLSRVDKIIDPKTGAMLEFANECIILEGVTVRGEHHRFFPQNEYPFWREIWLRRHPGPSQRAGAAEACTGPSCAPAHERAVDASSTMPCQ